MKRPLALPVVLLAAALAAGTPRPARGEAEGATEIFRQGVEALREGDYSRAERLFRYSYSLEPVAATQCNLALTYERWGGRERQALEAYRRCAEDDETGRFRPRALERAAELRRTLPAETAPEPTTAEPSEGAEPGGAGAGAGTAAGSTGESGGGSGPSAGPAPARRRGLVLTHPLRWLGVAGGVLAVAAFGTAIGLHVWARGVYDELDDRYQGAPVPPGTADYDRVGRGETGVRAAIGLYVSGALLGAGALLFVVLDALLERRALEAARIGLAPTDGGLAVSAAFVLD